MPEIPEGCEAIEASEVDVLNALALIDAGEGGEAWLPLNADPESTTVYRYVHIAFNWWRRVSITYTRA